MMPFATIQMLLLAALLFSFTSNVVCSLAVPSVVRWTSTWAPGSRHRGLVLVAVAPLTLGFAGLLSAALPSLLGLRWPAFDHCLQHVEHSHLCFVHSVPRIGSWAGWLVIAGVVTWLCSRLAHGTKELVAASQVVRRLSRCAQYDSRRSLWVLPANDALCLSIGLMRPQLIASEGLLASASSDELEIMVTHEEAHARRRDSLVRLIARAATIAMLPPARHQLLAALELASEQACDEHAVLRSGDRLRVAETILSVERRMRAICPVRDNPLVSAFGAGSVPQRIEAMLQPAREGSACAVLACVLGSIVVSLLSAHDQVHHTTESLLGLFSR